MTNPPKTYQGVLIKKIELAKDTYDFVIESKEPVEFEAGQFMYVTVTDGQEPTVKRAYSICSAPQNKTELTLCIKIVEGGRASNWFRSLKEGDKVEFMAPLGHFTFDESSTCDALFVATGTGLAPLFSMISDRLAQGDKRKMHLVFGLRHIAHMFYQEQLEKLASKHENFTYTFTLSRPEDESWTGEKGRVTDWLNNNFDQEFKANNVDIYICGLGEMVEGVQKIFTEKGVPKENVNFERYS